MHPSGGVSEVQEEIVHSSSTALDPGSTGRASKKIKLPVMLHSLFASLRYTFWLIIKTRG